MAELSPEAQAVLDAVLTDNLTGPERFWARAHAAAALRAAVDQVVPEAENAVGDQHDEARLDQWPRIRWKLLAIAADLLEHQAAPVPVAVSERLPEPSVKVLAHYLNGLGKRRTVCAIWVPAKSRSDDLDLCDDDFTEYDEETDKFYWPEGWYEAIENCDDFGWVKIYEGEVIYWQPLPQWPARAIPLPATEPQP